LLRFEVFIGNLFLDIQGHYRMVESLALKYDESQCLQKLRECESGRLPFYKNPGLRAELEDDLKTISDIIAGADPDNKTLAKKRKQGNTAGSAKRGRK
jgi:hypothetical protein